MRLVRVLLGSVIAGLTVLFGLMALAGAVDLLSAQGVQEKVWVGLGLGVVLMAMGVAMVVVTFRANRRGPVARPRGQSALDAGARPDPDEAKAMLLGATMATLGDDNLDGGDGD